MMGGLPPASARWPRSGASAGRRGAGAVVRAALPAPADRGRSTSTPCNPGAGGGGGLAGLGAILAGAVCRRADRARRRRRGDPARAAPHRAATATSTATVETALGIFPGLAAGAALVALAILVVLPAPMQSQALTGEDLSLALSVVLLGQLMMVTRRTALAQTGRVPVDRERADPGRRRRAGHAAGGGTRRSPCWRCWARRVVSGVFFFRIRERFEARGQPPSAGRPGERTAASSSACCGAVFGARAGGDGAACRRRGAGLRRRISASRRGWINAAAATLAFLLGLRAALGAGPALLLLVDPLAAHMAILTASSAMTTAWFSRDYITVEAGGRAARSRRACAIYHALFQACLGCLLLALLSNNCR